MHSIVPTVPGCFRKNMSKNYFQFKQFTVYQGKAAMKVCTDACLFGAWVTEKMQNEKIKNILDIGAGTGLLSLMLSQKTDAQIDAVEIDEQAAQQSKENFEASPWSERLSIFNSPIQQFNSTITYDVIISNPPFFLQSLRSDNEQKNLAKHSGSLFSNELTDVVDKLLAPKGKFTILLPYIEFKRFEIIAKEKQLHLVQKADIQQSPSHSFFRTMGIFSKQILRQSNNQPISIKDDVNQYTSCFKNLLKDYYLHI
jgi:tRNA1Val (adenine37-N6)-methyltransferase